MSKNVIQIHRGPVLGDLSFEQDGKEILSATCCWDLKHKIPAKKYHGYKTRMSTKKDSVTGMNRPGIWIPGVPSYQGIFIHEGNTTNYDTRDVWSDGCIILERKEMMKIWDSIKTTDEVSIEIEDGLEVKNFYQKRI